MFEDWFRQIQLNIPFDDWERLPQFAGFKSEYFDGKAIWTPRPKAYNAVLNLASLNCTELLNDSAMARSRLITVRTVSESDWSILRDVFVSAFYRLPPFCTLAEGQQLMAASDCLNHTRSGGDGIFLPESSVVAMDSTAKVLGSILITRWKPESNDGFGGSEADAHITWAFVQPFDCGIGVGTLMLHEVVSRLQTQGFQRLFTTFFSGNDSSMLWHWRNGFRLLPYDCSRRKS